MRFAREDKIAYSIYTAFIIGALVLGVYGCTKAVITASPAQIAAAVEVQTGDVGASVSVKTDSSGTVTDSNVTVSVPDVLPPVYFDFNSAVVRSDATIQLIATAAALNKFREASVVIEGHCDERGTNEYNQALGQRRATAVKNYLSILGVDPARMRTISYGEERPACVLDVNQPEWCHQENRRVEFVISHEVL